ncbi:MAG: ArsR family transcriptional regulator [Candidatus Helarchaeota archaeon]
MNENVLGLFKSKVRMKIFNFLMNNRENAKFNEIASELDMVPSTLEYHLKQMVTNGLIYHVDNKYGVNAYSMIIWGALNKILEFNSQQPFLKNHLLPINDQSLIKDFSKLELKVVPDMISLFTIFQQKFQKKISNFRIAGTFNLELEERIMKISGIDFNFDKIELMTDHENFVKFISYENFDFFLNLTKLENLKLYLIDKCNFYLGISDELGMLFLPKIDGTIDFQACLIFDNPENLKWLEKFYDSLIKKSKQVFLSRSLIQDKDLFLKEIRKLSKSS